LTWNRTCCESGFIIICELACVDVEVGDADNDDEDDGDMDEVVRNSENFVDNTGDK